VAIPDFQSIMRPPLAHLSDGQLRGTSATLAALAETFDLTEAELNELSPSGTRKVFENRIAWAKSCFLIGVAQRELEPETDSLRRLVRELAAEGPRTLGTEN